MSKIKFITFEGGEGSGKSTQSTLLYNYLKEKNIKVIHTREPGGTNFALKIRELLLTSLGEDIVPMTELLLHNAARSEHVKKVIIPEIEKGTIIICDRYIDSTIAYQAYGHNLPLEYVMKVHEIVTNNLFPDLTFFLDIKPQDGLKRASNRLNNSKSDENRYENMAQDFHIRVYEGFKAIIKQDEKRFKVIDATKSIDEIHAEIVEHIFKVI